MSTYDLSRFATDFYKRYAGVRMQQGRVILDDDWNENERLHTHEQQRTLVDVIGADGSPDFGFAIASPVVDGSGHVNFLAKAGTMYVGGLRLELPYDENYQWQNDWLQESGEEYTGAPTHAQIDLAYLEVWQQAVTATEDSELLEPALSGPDTSVRIRTMHRVHLASDIGQQDCSAAWDAVQAEWLNQNLGTMGKGSERIVDSNLLVGFDPGSDPNDLCNPPVAGGYLGAENQAIRVQLVDASHFTWGFDNAAPMYRVQVSMDQGQMKVVTLQMQPRDQAHWPLANQIVEILPWSAVLPNNEKLSELRGHLSRVESSYSPDNKQLTLVTPLPVGFGTAWQQRPDAGQLGQGYFFMRVWNRGTDITSDPAIFFQPNLAIPLLHTGLNITFGGSQFVANDFWIIAARPETPTQVIPWSLTLGIPPLGMHRYFTPLGLIQWSLVNNQMTGKVIADCRDTFRPLIALKNCATRIVGDNKHSLGNYLTIQDAINSLPLSGGEVLVLPGKYPENIMLQGLSNITVRGCGVRTLIQPIPGQGPAISIVDSNHISIQCLGIAVTEDMGIQLKESPAGWQQDTLNHIVLEDLDIKARDMSAIWGRGGSFVKVKNCRMDIQVLDATIAANNQPGQLPAMFVIANDLCIENNQIITEVGTSRSQTALGGLQVGGGSDRVEIRRNKISGGNGNGITLGSVRYVTREQATLSQTDFQGFLVAMYNLEATYTLLVAMDANGCVGVTTTGTPPVDSNGNPLVPVSDGALTDVCILENCIQTMGCNGIAMVLEQDILILADRLLIAENVIQNNLQVSLNSQLALPVDWARGGIVLAHVSDLEIRDNVIKNNGGSFLEPVCGIFIVYAEGARFAGNRIFNNGARFDTTNKPKPGQRGGIVIRFAVPITQALNSTLADLNPPRGDAAVKIIGNTILAPEGRALKIVGIGAMAVEENQLASFGTQGVDLMAQLQNILTAISNKQTPDIDLIDLLGGAAVAIINLGVSYEFTAFGLEQTGQGLFEIMKALAVNDANPSGGTELSLTPNFAKMTFVGTYLYEGNILFHHNQVVLDLLSKGSSTPVSSILLLSADDIGMLGNQCESIQENQDWTLIHALVFGFSVRVNANRFKEGLISVLSAITLAILNHTEENQGTHCFLVFGAPNIEQCAPNRSLIQLIAPTGCETNGAYGTIVKR